MMPQATTAPRSAAATGAAPAAAAGAGGDVAAPTDIMLALLTGAGAPFSQALAALNAGAAGATAAAAGAAGGSADGATSDDAGGELTGDASTDAAALTSDPASAALAAVLQWLQQHGSFTPPQTSPNGGDGGDGGDAESGTVGAAGKAGGASGIGLAPAPGPAPTLAATIAPASSGSAPADGLLADERGATVRQQAAALAASAPTADSTAAGSGMDLAVALRAAAAATQPTATPVERSIPIPVHDRHWPQAVAAQLLTLSDQKVQAAILRLSPEHLGPLEVRIDLQNSRVDVTFSAAHGETRAALEQSIPQLREVLAGAGLTLGQANVQQQTRRESQNQGGSGRAVAAAGDPAEAPAVLARAIGLVDEYV